MNAIHKAFPEPILFLEMGLRPLILLEGISKMSLQNMQS